MINNHEEKFKEIVKDNFSYSNKYVFVLSKENGDGIICLSASKNENSFIKKSINCFVIFVR